MSQTLLALLFLLSGFSGLVLQTVWSRMLVLVFGSTTFAISTVLTTFMGGLAIGSWIAARWSHRINSSARAVALYGVLELLVGAYALLFPLLLGLVEGVSASSYHISAIVRFVLVALLLVVPTAAMGATLPVLARAFCGSRTSDPTATSRKVGTLYSINTAGAVLGVLAAGFILLPTIGTRATNITACVVDLLLGGVALLLARRSFSTRKESDGATFSNEKKRDRRQILLARVALVSIGVSGAVAMAYEVVWTRALTLIVGSSTYAFSLILLCFLVGLSGGAALYSRRQVAAPDQAANLAVAHLMAAATATAGLILMDDLPAIMLIALQYIDLTASSALLLKFSLAAIVILLPATFMGMVFPAVVRLYAVLGHSPTHTTGYVYSVNTLGAIVGSFVAGFVLLPVFGLQHTLAGLVASGALLALLFALLASKKRTGVFVAIVASVTAVVGSTARPWNLQEMNAGVFRVSHYEGLRLVDANPADARQPAASHASTKSWLAAARSRLPASLTVDTFSGPMVGSRLVFHAEGVTATVGVSRIVDQALTAGDCWVRDTLLVNGKPDASLSVLRRGPRGGCAALLGVDDLEAATAAVSPAGDMETQVLSGLLPLLLHRGSVKRALVIGWGSGVTVGSMLRATSKLKLTAIELEQQVVTAARHFEPHNNAPLSHPRLELVNDDGRNYLARSPHRFDVIVSEPSNPWMAGCGNLFTVEFFEQVRQHLAPNGVFLQWLQAYEIAPDNAWSILGSLSDVFAEVDVFGSIRAGADLLLISRRKAAEPAEQGGGRFDLQRLRARLSQLRRSAAGDQLGLIGVGTAEDIFVRLLADTTAVRRLSAGIPRNTDDNARIEFATPKDMIAYRGTSTEPIITALRRALQDPRRRFVGAPANRALCWAELRAGRPKAAQRWAVEGSDCHKAAAALRRPPRPIAAKEREIFSGVPAIARAIAREGEDPMKTFKTVVEQIDPGAADHDTFALLGHLQALADRQHEAILLLEAARSTPSSRGQYPGIAEILCRQYLRAGVPEKALQEAQKASLGNLSTVQQQ